MVVYRDMRHAIIAVCKPAEECLGTIDEFLTGNGTVTRQVAVIRAAIMEECGHGRLFGSN